MNRKHQEPTFKIFVNILKVFAELEFSNSQNDRCTGERRKKRNRSFDRLKYDNGFYYVFFFFKC